MPEGALRPSRRPSDAVRPPAFAARIASSAARPRTRAPSPALWCSPPSLRSPAAQTIPTIGLRPPSTPSGQPGRQPHRPDQQGRRTIRIRITVGSLFDLEPFCRSCGTGSLLTVGRGSRPQNPDPPHRHSRPSVRRGRATFAGVMSDRLRVFAICCEAGRHPRATSTPWPFRRLFIERSPGETCAGGRRLRDERPLARQPATCTTFTVVTPPSSTASRSQSCSRDEPRRRCRRDRLRARRAAGLRGRDLLPIMPLARAGQDEPSRCLAIVRAKQCASRSRSRGDLYFRSPPATRPARAGSWRCMREFRPRLARRPSPSTVVSQSREAMLAEDPRAALRHLPQFDAHRRLREGDRPRLRADDHRTPASTSGISPAPRRSRSTASTCPEPNNRRPRLLRRALS